MNEAQTRVRDHRLERASREWLVDRIEALETERDELREALGRIADGNWNRGREHDITVRKFARRSLSAFLERTP